MLARIVEHPRHAFLPEEVMAADLEPALLRLFGHDQRIMETDDACRRTAMGHDLRTTRQDAEQRGMDARNSRDRCVGVGYRRRVLLDLMAPDLEQESAPGAAGYVEVARMDLVQRRNFIVMAQQVVQVGLDLVMALLQFGQHRKRLERILAAQRQARHAPQDHVPHPKIEVLNRLLRDPDVLGQIEPAFLADLGVLFGFHDGSWQLFSLGSRELLTTLAPFQGPEPPTGAADSLNFLRQASENM